MIAIGVMQVRLKALGRYQGGAGWASYWGWISRICRQGLELYVDIRVMEVRFENVGGCQGNAC
jgi:hypothetical protein